MSTVAKRLARHFTFERSRVLTPVPPDQVWVFFKGFPIPSHRGISHITDKANAESVSTSKYLRTHLHRTHPEASHQCGWKGSGKPQQPAPLRGENERCILSFFRNSSHFRSRSKRVRFVPGKKIADIALLGRDPPSPRTNPVDFPPPFGKTPWNIDSLPWTASSNMQITDRGSPPNRISQDSIVTYSYASAKILSSENLGPAKKPPPALLSFPPDIQHYLVDCQRRNIKSIAAARQ
jgi:hypothetical protein